VSNSLDVPTRLSDNYLDFILTLIKEFRLEEVIETGAYDGLGSTSLFAKTGLPVHSIECHAMNFIAAKVNLSGYENVKIHHAYSLSLEEMKSFIRSDELLRDRGLMEEKGIKFDHDDPIWYYENEIVSVVSAPKKESLLKEMVSNKKRQLIFLDSSGGVGWLEFMEIASLNHDMLSNKVVLLDDINHIKHWRSINKMKDFGEIIYSGDGRLAAQECKHWLEIA